MPAQLSFHARTADAAPADVLAQLKKLEGVVSVAKDDTAEGVSGFVIFENAELSAAARNRKTDGDLFVLTDPAREAPAKKKRGDGNNQKSAKTAAKKGVACTGDFFNGPSPSTMRSDDRVTRRGRGGRGGNEFAGGRGAGRGGGRGGGGRGAGGEGRGRRGGGGAPNRRPRVKAHVACVHNVQYNATNDQVFQAFKAAGHIFDIARSEDIALVYFAEPDHVTNAILQMNGKKLLDQHVSVCNGGEMSIPVPPPPPGPPMPPGPPGPLVAGPNGPPVPPPM
mmetsp:Transcript_17234/g.53510  ORF Transcript_17234/g.53510 Transcript_17234/m.53510 type:complete len:280 (-) Transcript_17234:265-1104(-)